MVPIYCELLYFINKLTGLQLTSCVVYLCFNCSYSHIEWAESSHHHCGGGGSRYHHPGLHGVRFHHREKVRSRGPHWLSATVSLVRSLSLPFCPSKATIAVEFTPSPTCVWSHPPTIMLYTVEMWPLMHFSPPSQAHAASIHPEWDSQLQILPSQSHLFYLFVMVKPRSPVFFHLKTSLMVFVILLE